MNFLNKNFKFSSMSSFKIRYLWIVDELWRTKSKNEATESVNIFCILDVTVMYDTILESEQKSKVFYPTFNVPWTKIKILVQNGPNFFSMKNEFYLTGNHRGNIRNQNKIKNKNFQNFIEVTFYKNVNIFWSNHWILLKI